MALSTAWGSTFIFIQLCLEFLLQLVWHVFDLGWARYLCCCTAQDSVEVELYLNSLSLQATMVEFLGAMPQDGLDAHGGGPGTYTSLALQTVRTKVFSEKEGARPQSMQASKAQINTSLPFFKIRCRQHRDLGCVFASQHL